MQTTSKEIIALERTFWQSMVDEEPALALELLAEPALMISPHGALKFDHAGYQKMAEQGAMRLKAFDFSDIDVVFANDSTAVMTYRVEQTLQMRDKAQTLDQEMINASVWVRKGRQWRCVMHTETPVEPSRGN